MKFELKGFQEVAVKANRFDADEPAARPRSKPVYNPAPFSSGRTVTRVTDWVSRREQNDTLDLLSERQTDSVDPVQPTAPDQQNLYFNNRGERTGFSGR